MNNILLNNIVNMLQDCVDMLYQENLSSAYKMLAVVYPKMEELITGMEQTHQKEIKEKLQLVLDAMEDGDNILIADTIQYELIEMLSAFDN
ncbi:MAG: hypothetical protein E7271_01205 [Lachnospiraceae bacterium]|jgi:hypothetical protein|nr:hypothetical protein [Lachnospiraceae bacterium]